jgi:hypothetical protein
MNYSLGSYFSCKDVLFLLAIEKIFNYVISSYVPYTYLIYSLYASIIGILIETSLIIFDKIRKTLFFNSNYSEYFLFTDSKMNSEKECIQYLLENIESMSLDNLKEYRTIIGAEILSRYQKERNREQIKKQVQKFYDSVKVSDLHNSASFDFDTSEYDVNLEE